MSGGNTYTDCAGVGQPVEITRQSDAPGPDRVGGDGEGICSVCGRVVSQRSGVAKRHADKRSSDDRHAINCYAQNFGKRCTDA